MNTNTHDNAGGSRDRALDDRVHLGRSQVADERVTRFTFLEVPASVRCWNNSCMRITGAALLLSLVECWWVHARV